MIAITYNPIGQQFFYIDFERGKSLVSATIIQSHDYFVAYSLMCNRRILNWRKDYFNADYFVQFPDEKIIFEGNEEDFDKFVQNCYEYKV